MSGGGGGNQHQQQAQRQQQQGAQEGKVAKVMLKLINRVTLLISVLTSIIEFAKAVRKCINAWNSARATTDGNASKPNSKN